MNYAEFFSQGLLGRIIPAFPYVQRFCPYCDQPCKLVDAIHIEREPEHYKALFLCENPFCGAYDEEARSQYARVYYSSEEAFRALELHRIWHDIKKKT
jgi:hypothetical protein